MPTQASNANRFRPTHWSALQARRIKLWLALAGKSLFRPDIEFEGMENVPPEEPVTVTASRRLAGDAGAGIAHVQFMLDPNTRQGSSGQRGPWKSLTGHRTRFSVGMRCTVC